MSAGHLAYTLLWCIALPFVLLRLIWRARKQPDYLQNLGERFGYIARRPAPCIWLHAVSVGETRAAVPLVQALCQHYPQFDILLTHATPTGRAAARELFGNNPNIFSAYLPYDLPWCVQRFLQRTQPHIGLLMETELWPNLISACQSHQVPLMLINARLSEKSARGYARFPHLAYTTVRGLSGVGAQTPADAARLQALGARNITVTGNMKFDVDVAPAQFDLAEKFAHISAHRKIILAASTREGEEELILQAYKRLADKHSLLVIVPRHPQRFNQVAQLIERTGFTYQRRSSESLIQESDKVWLGDSMGEMFAYYACAEVALMGGSWLPFGGQNLIEPCLVGTPVILGPHVFNFAQAAQDAVAAGAAFQFTDIDEGLLKAMELIKHPEQRWLLRDICMNFAQQHKGATQKTIQLITSVRI